MSKLPNTASRPPIVVCVHSGVRRIRFLVARLLYFRLLLSFIAQQAHYLWFLILEKEEREREGTAQYPINDAWRMIGKMKHHLLSAAALLLSWTPVVHSANTGSNEDISIDPNTVTPQTRSKQSQNPSTTTHNVKQTNTNPSEMVWWPIRQLCNTLWRRGRWPQFMWSC